MLNREVAENALFCAVCARLAVEPYSQWVTTEKTPVSVVLFVLRHFVVKTTSPPPSPPPSLPLLLPLLSLGSNSTLEEYARRVRSKSTLEEYARRVASRVRVGGTQYYMLTICIQYLMGSDRRVPPPPI